MWQTVITFLVVGIALFFIGRKLYRQLRRAADPSQSVSCGCSGGCSACNVSCDDKNTNQNEPKK
ncbi:MAG: FeoB-associated Cys-rich membrane protein [Desulfocapsa sp.]|nr:FeoB-associated Cys-rich membrane protein [Desulfocapsa sp.]